MKPSISGHWPGAPQSPGTSPLLALPRMALAGNKSLVFFLPSTETWKGLWPYLAPDRGQNWKDNLIRK